MSRTDNAAARWGGAARDALAGRTITGVRYMTQEECDRLGWHHAAVILVLDNGEMLYPSRDDEGNNAGALFTTIKDLETIPVINIE